MQLATRISTLAFLTLVSFFTTDAASAAEILKGAGRGPFMVRVESLDPEARAAGLSEAGLAKVVQNRLQKRKLTTAVKAEREVYVRVVVLTSNDVQGKVLGYGAHVELSLREKAVLKRDKSMEFLAPVWFKGNVTVSNPQNFTTQVVGAIATLTDQFLNDYLAVN